MIIRNDYYSKPFRVCLYYFDIPDYCTAKEALWKFKKLAGFYMRHDYYICCDPFKPSDGHWWIYLQIERQ